MESANDSLNYTRKFILHLAFRLLTGLKFSRGIGQQIWGKTSLLVGQAEHKPHHITANYLALEAQREVRHKFVTGEIFAMASTRRPVLAVASGL